MQKVCSTEKKLLIQSMQKNNNILPSNIEFIDGISIHELEILLRASDFTLFIPQNDDYSMSHIIDIMASSSVLITNCEDVVTSWVNGICIRVEDPIDDILNAVESCAKEPTVYQGIRSKAVKRAAELSREKFGEKFVELKKYITNK